MRYKVLTAGVAVLAALALGLPAVAAGGKSCCGSCGGGVTAAKATPSPAPKAAGGTGECAEGKCTKAERTKGKSAAGHCPCAAKVAAALKKIDAAILAVEAGKTKDALAVLKEARTLVAAAHKAFLRVKPKQTFVNAKCPIMGGKIDPEHTPAELTREFHGRKVGFCCAGCPKVWDKLTDAQKQAKLDAVAAK